jgi:potassium-dependent mechanosensitive channel
MSWTELWQRVADAFGYRLFSLGSASVSIGAMLQVALFVIVAYWLSRVLRGVMRRLQKTQRASGAMYTLDRLAHYVVIILGFFFGLSSIGVDFTAFAVVAGALGIGIGLGLQQLVANFFAGIVLLLDRSFTLGDFVELSSGLRGEVKRINIRSTLLTTTDGVDIIVPNSEFVNGQVINWTLNDESSRFHIPFGVAYGSDKERVRQAGLEAAAAAPDDLLDAQRPPAVWFVGFGDSSLDFELVVWVRASGVRKPASTRALLLWEIHSALAHHGIEVPFPQRDLHLRSFFGRKDDDAFAWVADELAARRGSSSQALKPRD